MMNVFADKKKYRCRHGQIKLCSHLSYVGWGKVQNDFSWRQFDTAVTERCTYTLLRLFDSRVGQSDNFNGRKGFVAIRFDSNFLSAKPEGCEGFHECMGHFFVLK